jgi:hypothetical protein
LKRWGRIVNDVAIEDYEARPGMTNIVQLPNKKWMLVHEFPNGGVEIYNVSYPVYYRIADSPLEFNSAKGYPVIANKTQPNGSPYVTWSPVGGENGTIIVSDADNSGVFTNQALGDVNSWILRDTPQPQAYSRYVHVIRRKQSHLEIVSAGTYDQTPGFTPNISVSILPVEKVISDFYLRQ